MRGANLRGSRFQEALLQGTLLQGADLRGADLRHVHLRFTDLEGAFFDQRTRFPPDFDPYWAGMQLWISATPSPEATPPTV